MIDRAAIVAKIGEHTAELVNQQQAQQQHTAQANVAATAVAERRGAIAALQELLIVPNEPAG